MATVFEPRAAAKEDESRLLFHNVSWDEYEAILRIVGTRHVRVTYDRGDLEIMTKSQGHERYKKLIGWMIESLTAVLEIPCEAAGETTWRKKAKERGLEADESYYTLNAELVECRDVDLEVDPPPDLTIEVEISQSVLDRIAIYAALGVPEIWRYDGETLHVECLSEDGKYLTVPTSPSFPFLPMEEVAAWLQRSDHLGQSLLRRQFLHWVRETLVPLYQVWRAANSH